MLKALQFSCFPCCIWCRKDPVLSPTLVDVKLVENSIFFQFTKEVTEKNFAKAVQTMLNRVRNYPKKSFETIVICLESHSQGSWKIILQNLSNLTYTLLQIDFLNFYNSSLSLYQLAQLYKIFKQHQAQQILFPNVIIERTVAAAELLSQSVEEKELERRSSENMGENELQKLVTENLEEKQYLSKEEFLIIMEGEGKDGELFLKKVYVNNRKTVYDLRKGKEGSK